ncbi:FtsW/RodA/SpoVE family cell cycle protein [Aliarcobacter cryaerophilus]|jgi:cell division protein FtsW|uniref:FtsW/RodA/SpoVE family cell cycle protein n=1 Tax=Aliarcobacter cryaerophilus TaxID=28198 RepID=UPI0008308E9A|nr:FtsW/RodA/SpoVE family cell cycle protein [Aliarcobacter cryaerophilus]MCT7467801.1 FtsW/RodA/SpoVE family cell cycle protein [Aliarcobacter cryaerophilus]MCT7471570.1 FtsW/RodA/SpoVE family cell cycle protein [Aliarcobacter cryaerophilus]MCT7505268.1 FtsW/RodA/SpoVE family cell cycle protein [Aliarcobacter cryaerophilus]MCT7524539.1 FtsW/RodA/SpoVE family cell cycle protein [Aliarcobacter cryaerophilus]MCT7539268.1 FtsW/RodA/SpoVE family cell cycle protein [Aliarcobacter cryaerophilus]
MDYIKNKIKLLTTGENLREPDYFLFILVSMLIIVSIVFSYSLTIYTVEFLGYGQFHYILRQGLVGIFCIYLMWWMARLNPNKIMHRTGMTLFGVGLFLMVIMPFLPASLVTASGGANRWIRLPGISLSPVEIFKIGFIYFLSWSFFRKVIHQPKKGLFGDLLLLSPYFLVFIFIVFLIAVLQKDLGQVALLTIIMLTLIIFANRSLKIIFALILIAIVGMIVLIAAAPHRINRIHSWWSMVQDGILSVLPSTFEQYLRIKNLPEPYQVSHSLNAIHNGGFFGQGISLGDLKVGFLSEVHTDFVLAGITEEIGWLGIFIITTILMLVILRILAISRKVDSKIFHLFTTGIALMIIVAFLINGAGISGIIPIKGIAVPFLSYGGSSLITSSFAIGLVLSISRTVKKYEPQKSVIKEKPKRIIIR